MKLSNFLTEHNAEILSEWDRFARQTAPAGSDVSVKVLRDHAQELLTAIASNIELMQGETKPSRTSKSCLLAQDKLYAAASIHGMLRHHGGFHLREVASEFVALRASVMHLWLPLVKNMTRERSYEMMGFNEAIDEALSESINTFSEQNARIRDTFLAVLGHDLRTPLNVITMNGELLKKVPDVPDTVHACGARIVISAARMALMINDLLEYGRTQLGEHLALKRHALNIEKVCQAILDEARAVHPAQAFVLKASGAVTGSFDEARLQQVFANLLCNAARYSEPDQPITVTVEGQDNAIAVKVHNVGPVIPEKSLQTIFEPLVQLAQEDEFSEFSESASHSVGLGLYIAREITEAHGGSIHAASSRESGTAFTVLLPRNNDLKLEA